MVHWQIFKFFFSKVMEHISSQVSALFRIPAGSVLQHSVGSGELCANVIMIRHGKLDNGSDRHRADGTVWCRVENSTGIQHQIGNELHLEEKWIQNSCI